MEIKLFYAYFVNMKKSFVTSRYQTIVAIDPDVDRNGIARLDVASKSLTIDSFSFPETLDYLYRFKSTEDYSLNDTIVIIEAGWLNHTHWHVTSRDNRNVIAAKGNSVGRNHEVGRKLAEMCEHWHIPYRLVKPLKKIWKGKDGKITAQELTIVTGYKGRTNQEERDSALLAWVSADLPVRI